MQSSSIAASATTLRTHQFRAHAKVTLYVWREEFLDGVTGQLKTWKGWRASGYRFHVAHGSAMLPGVLHICGFQFRRNTLRQHGRCCQVFGSLACLELMCARFRNLCRAVEHQIIPQWQKFSRHEDWTCTDGAPRQRRVRRDCSPYKAPDAEDRAQEMHPCLHAALTTASFRPEKQHLLAAIM